MDMLFMMAKMVACKNYADDFRAGRLHANPLGHFRRLDGPEGLADPHEGAVWVDPSVSFVQIGGTRLTGDMVKPIAFHFNLTDQVNVVCLYSIHSGLLQPTPDELPPDLKEKVYNQEFCGPDDFGARAVVITDPDAFMSRLNQALQRLYAEGGCRCYRHGLVKYTDQGPSFFDYMEKRISPLDPVFVKRARFRYQNEYRIAFHAGVDEKRARVLDIGDITDITHTLRTSELRGTYGCTVVQSE